MEAAIGPAPVLDENMDSIIIVDGLPIVDSTKTAKLSGFVVKKFSEYGTIAEHELPVDASGSSLGFLFLRFETPAQATAAFALNGKPMDKSHLYRISHYNDYEKYSNVPDVYAAPDPSEITKPVPPLNTWLLDPQLRDQFAIRYMDGDSHKTAIYWNDPFRKVDSQGRDLVYDGARESVDGRHWVERQIQFSPTGAYLVTFHNQGIALWGGPEFERICKFAHNNVAKVAFSPCERYLVTMSETVTRQETICEGILWNIHSGLAIKKFPGLAPADWPFVKFSHDGKYLTRVSAGGIAVIETATMQLVDGKPINAPGATEVTWAPKRNAIAYFVRGKNSQPDRICLYDVETKQMLREKHIFNVIDCNIYFQEAGNYLYAVTSLKKTKKTNSYSVFLLRLNQKDIPIEDITLDHKPTVFAVDPVNGHVAITCAVPSSGNSNIFKADISVFKLTDKALKKAYNVVLPIPSDSQIECFKLSWSPAGNTLVYGPQTNQTLGFYVLNVEPDTPYLVAQELEHGKATQLIWDPSGRYFVTVASRPFKNEQDGWHQQWKENVDDSYRVWTFQGQLLAHVIVPKLFQFHWRPRPVTLLTPEQIATVKQELKSVYWKKFDTEDEDIFRSKKSEATRRRQAIKSAWKEFRAACAEKHKADAEDRISLRHGMMSDDEADMVEIVEYDEEVIVTEEIVA